MSTSEVPQGWRVLGFGKHPEIAAAIQARLRDAGLAATNFALTDDEAGDARLIQELTAADYDGVLIGGFINGQDPEDPSTEQRTRWFNRILNIVHAPAPAAPAAVAVVVVGVVSALDHRFGWSSAPIAVLVLGNVLVFGGISLAELVIIQNNYAAATVTVNPQLNPALLALSIGSGSLFFSHINDAGFWLVKEYMGMNLPSMFKTWSSLETIIAVMGLLLALGLSLVI